MPRMRRAVRKIDNLEVAPIDYVEQEELIELLKIENAQVNAQYINILTIVYLIPIPLFIHLKHYRRSTIDSFLSIVVQICAIVSIRYLLFVKFQGHLRHLSNPLVFSGFMNLIALYVAVKQFDITSAKGLLYWFPLVSSVSASVAQYWMLSLDGNIDGLNNLKYKYKSA